MQNNSHITRWRRFKSQFFNNKKLQNLSILQINSFISFTEAKISLLNDVNHNPGLRKRVAVKSARKYKLLAPNKKMAGKSKDFVFCVKDNLFKDAMEYAAESKNAEVAEDLLAYFLEHK